MIAKLRVDPIFRGMVLQIVRENLDVIAGPIIKEVDDKIAESGLQRKKYY